ncbi:CotH kinase family protein [Acetobacter estunensis]|uniref:CotH kinase family protein n=1 Tax=Acetobacter estunensis TaxID=104097 RepID=UPI001C2D806A|nr:CotH kinase family protein [Acetobacter estunensis]MBV1835679.1 CotH kinase family protein [Acetobacter estunensis]MBV1836060.1 CotH kinase family protein [Acetobacter estunensis]
MTEISETDVTVPQSGDLIPVVRNVDGLSVLMHYDGEDIANAGIPSFVSSLLSTETTVPVGRPKSGCLRFVAIGSALPTVGTDEQVTLAILDGNSVLYADQGTGLTNMSVQGQTSANATKHNWKFKPKNPAGSKVSIRFGDWPDSTSIDLKAYGTIPNGDTGGGTAMDRTMIREAVCLELWRQIRRAYDYPENLIAPESAYEDASTTNFGNPLFSCDEIPVELYWTTDAATAPTFLGQYMWRSNNSNDTYLMDDSNAAHYLLQPQHGPTDLWSNGSSSYFSKYWEYSSPSSPNNAVPARLLTWLASCKTTSSNWASYAQYIDLNSWIDYAIFCWAVGSFDSVSNNVMLGSHNATATTGIWSLYAYDLDESLGVYWDTTGQSPTQEGNPFAQDAVFQSFWTYFAPQIGARWLELRKNSVLTTDNFRKIVSRYLKSMRPAAIAADQSAWGTNSISTIPYLIEWFDGRLTYGDTVMAATTATTYTVSADSQTVLVNSAVTLTVAPDHPPAKDVNIMLTSSLAGVFSQNPVVLSAGSGNAVETTFTPSAEGTAQITSTNDDGLNDPSSTNVIATATAQAPGAPTFTLTAGDGYVQVDVSAPSDNGGAAITEHPITYGATSGGETATFSPAITAPGSVQITGTNGTAIFVKVGATNSVGTTWATEQSATPKADTIPEHALVGNGNSGSAWGQTPGPLGITTGTEIRVDMAVSTLSWSDKTGSNVVLFGSNKAWNTNASVGRGVSLIYGQGGAFGVSYGDGSKTQSAWTSSGAVTDNLLVNGRFRGGVFLNNGTAAVTGANGLTYPAGTATFFSNDGTKDAIIGTPVTLSSSSVADNIANDVVVANSVKTNPATQVVNLFSAKMLDGTGKELMGVNFGNGPTGATTFPDDVQSFTWTVASPNTVS